MQYGCRSRGMVHVEVVAVKVYTRGPAKVVRRKAALNGPTAPDLPPIAQS